MRASIGFHEERLAVILLPRMHRDERTAENIPHEAALRVGTTRTGLGLLTRRPVAAGARIARIPGRIVDAYVMTRRGGTFADNCFRFGPETYLDPGDGIGRYVNHSCRPSAAVIKERNRLFLVSVRPIPRGGEITIDYSTILGDDDIWTMRCRCGERRCRLVIRNLGALPGELRAAYIAAGMVPRYVLATITAP